MIRTYSYGAADGLQYLALEWAEGEPLASFVTRSGNLAPPVVATIVEQIGAALTVAHRAGIIHRDLKPANIMYDPATQRAKLLDFGIARDSEVSPEERLTRAGFFVGTLQYVAPETLSGELVGEQADVYSLATITYYLLTECLPFTGKNPQGVVPATTFPAAGAAQRGSAGPSLHASRRSGRDAGARTRPVQAQ